MTNIKSIKINAGKSQTVRSFPVEYALQLHKVEVVVGVVVVT